MVFLDLRWFSFFQLCLDEVSNTLEPVCVLYLLSVCLEVLAAKFAYKAKYKQVCVNVIHLLNNKKAEGNYYWPNNAPLSGTILRIDMTFLEAFLEYITDKDKEI